MKQYPPISFYGWTGCEPKNFGGYMSKFHKDIKEVLKTMDGSNENTLAKLDKLFNEAIKQATEKDLSQSVSEVEGFLCDILDKDSTPKKSAWESNSFQVMWELWKS